MRTQKTTFSEACSSKPHMSQLVIPSNVNHGVEKFLRMEESGQFPKFLGTKLRFVNTIPGKEQLILIKRTWLRTPISKAL